MYTWIIHKQKKKILLPLVVTCPWRMCIKYEPIPAVLNDQQAKHVLGAQANVWTEYMGNTQKVEYMIFPRLSALSEVLWSPKAKKNYPDFEKRLQTQFKRYELWKANYSRAYFDLKATITPTKKNDGILLSLATNSKGGEIKYEAIGRHYPLTYSSPVFIKDSRKIIASYYQNNQLVSSFAVNFSINKASGRKINLSAESAKNWPGNGGAIGLVNGVLSDKGISSAEWLGWQGKDMEVVIDLGNRTIHQQHQLSFTGTERQLDLFARYCRDFCICRWQQLYFFWQYQPVRGYGYEYVQCNGEGGSGYRTLCKNCCKELWQNTRRTGRRRQPSLVVCR